MDAQKYPEIVERIEYVRKRLELNKSRFSQSFGMKPQTYNNFIGPQATKPNIELIYGVVDRFNVNPDWLLTGSGEIFLYDSQYPQFSPTPVGESTKSTIQPPRLRKKIKVAE